MLLFYEKNQGLNRFEKHCQQYFAKPCSTFLNMGNALIANIYQTCMAIIE